MDLCLLAAALGTADFLRDDAFGWQPWSDDDPVYIAIGVPILFVSFIVGPVLVVTRSLRDEYAEQLWKRTVELLVNVLAIAPLVIILGTWAAYAAIGGEELPDALGFLNLQMNFWTSLVTAWQTFLLLFVGIFQFLRWRDSR
ncbi:hypothetical protein AAW00_03500 [Aurantiacibacter luteus]|uniref:Uncharacterized protein n=2 Tax=Aurantiacibacter luteus TaxID=1581420 RepID=A0A0G9N1T4_9SPHN|nr:hypothetical protein AAW00_03500 [Aurantiacibacter luteus]